MNCLPLFLSELGSHPRSPAFTFITAFIFAIAFTFAVAVTLAILFAVVFTTEIINLQEKLTAKFCCHASLSIYILNSSGREMLPNIHCKLPFGNTVVKQSCPNDCQVALVAVCCDAPFSSTAATLCCQAMLPIIPFKPGCQALVSSTAVKPCCSRITGQEVPLSTVANPVEDATTSSHRAPLHHAPFRTASCRCKLPPHLILCMRARISKRVLLVFARILYYLSRSSIGCSGFQVVQLCSMRPDFGCGALPGFRLKLHMGIGNWGFST